MRITRRAGGLAVVTVLLIAGITAGGFWVEGYRAYIVHTGSMVPTYRPGDLVLDRPVRGHLQVGQVITFRHSETTTDVVTHRISSLESGLIHTKGDANPSPDAWEIRPAEVRGTVAWSLPRLGYLAVFLKQPTGVGAVMAATFGLVLLWSLFFPDEAAIVRRLPAHARTARARSAHSRPSHRRSRPTKVARVARTHWYPPDRRGAMPTHPIPAMGRHTANAESESAGLAILDDLLVAAGRR